MTAPSCQASMPLTQTLTMPSQICLGSSKVARSTMALRRPVTVGELTGQGFEILDGLFDEELVVTAGVSRIRDSLRVRIPGATQAGS